MAEDLSQQERELIANLIKDGKPVPARYLPSISDSPCFNLITANNVFAHTRNLSGFASGAASLLTDDGIFVESVDENGTMTETGRDNLRRFSTGYVSYVRGENPYTFPYRIYPDEFAPMRTFAGGEQAREAREAREIVEIFLLFNPGALTLLNILVDSAWGFSAIYTAC